MGQLNEMEYAIVVEALLNSSRSNYVKSNPETSKMVAEAIQVLKSIMKGKPSIPAPDGGSSYCSCSTCKGEKIHRLLNFYGVKIG